MNRINYVEIRDAFPEGKQIVARLLKRKKFVLDVCAWDIRETMKDPYMTEWEKTFACLIIEHMHLPDVVAEYNRLKRYAFFYNNKKSGDYALKVENARNVPIESLIEGKVRSYGKKAVCSCPFHEEKQPSFHIYKNSNSFFCFSCKRGGDVITFVKLMHQLNFKEAVRYLNGLK